MRVPSSFYGARKLADRIKGGCKFSLTPTKLRTAQAAMGKRDTSVADLAKELGISKVTLYRHVTPEGK